MCVSFPLMLNIHVILETRLQNPVHEHAEKHDFYPCPFSLVSFLSHGKLFHSFRGIRRCMHGERACSIVVKGCCVSQMWLLWGVLRFSWRQSCSNTSDASKHKLLVVFLTGKSVLNRLRKMLSSISICKDNQRGLSLTAEGELVPFCWRVTKHLAIASRHLCKTGPVHFPKS